MVNRLLIILYFASLFAFSILPVTDPDFGWHYRCGADLLKGHPCLTNEFSYFLANYHAYYPSFIFDGVTALVYNTIGFMGLSILHATMITIVAYLMIRASQLKLITAAVFPVILYLTKGVLNFGWRPQMVTYMIVVGFYIFLEKIYEKRLKWLLILPILMMIWVNTHIGFFTGIVLLYFATTDRFVAYLLKRTRSERNELLWFAGIAIFSFIATGMNPFGFHVYEELYRHMQSPLNTMIAEWVPPAPFHLIIMTGISLSIFVLMAVRKKWSTYQVLTLLFFLITTWLARRNIPLFYTISVMQLISLLPKYEIKISQSVKEMFLPFLGAVTIGLFFIQLRHTLPYSLNWETYCTKGQAVYPCELFKEYPQIKGNVYATYEIGGFMIWQRPDLKVFVDGRMPAWHDENGESPYAVYLKILQTQPGWNERLRKDKTDFILVGQGTFLDLLLDVEAETYGWKKVYENKYHALFQSAL